MRHTRRRFLVRLNVAIAGLSAACVRLKQALGAGSPAEIHLAQGQWAGEPTATSVLLQSRLTASPGPVDGDVPGAAGVARFEISRDETFQNSQWTEWMHAVPEHDFIVRAQISQLEPATKYFYRLQFGPDETQTRMGPVGSFRTLAGASVSTPVKFVVWSCMNYAFFHQTKHEDPNLGYPALQMIQFLHPDFIVATGDNVYYDHPASTPATTPETMRKKWHEQFVQRRFVALLNNTPVFWEKDDHDFRYNDADLTGTKQPSVDLGNRIFREQVPILPPGDDGVTYRTHRVSRELQIWLVEGRDYRSPNRTSDSSMKSLWGQEQYRWLQKTLKESDASFKLIISPTPLVGPDRNSKRDNHANLKGFRHEGEEFFAWLQENQFSPEKLFFICGDRHWQYHAVHPSGFQEFSVGALHEENAVPGIVAGHPGSTDPQGLVKQNYLQREAKGGFLSVRVEPAEGGAPARIMFDFYHERGAILYSYLAQPS